MTLETNKLKLDRNIDEAYFFNGGKIIDKESTISSINGKYLIDKNKYEFERNVKVLNDSRIIESKKMHYYIESEKSYFFDETIITGDDYKINCDAGFYDPIELIGIFNKNAIIESNERIVHGDSIYFDEEKKYASISNNIKIIDNKEKLVLTGDYGELFEEKDSAIITKNPLAINILKRDWDNIDENEWDQVIQTNINGLFYCCKAVIPLMKEKRDGLIINVSSWSGNHVSLLSGVSYTSSKHALNAMTETINMKYCNLGIRATALCPGEVATAILDKRPKKLSSEQKNKMLQPDDLGQTIVFLCQMPKHVCINELTISPTWHRRYIADLGIEKL